MPNRAGCLVILVVWVLIGVGVYLLVGCATPCRAQQTRVQVVEQPEGCEDAPYTMQQNLPPMVK